jgi:hypothetical protein
MTVPDLSSPFTIAQAALMEEHRRLAADIGRSDQAEAFHLNRQLKLWELSTLYPATNLRGFCQRSRQQV